MYTKFLRKAVRKIESMRSGHCEGSGGSGGGVGHCS
jgi:hypothetical protein